MIGWRWCFWVGAILVGAVWVLLLFAFPETLYSREQFSMLEAKPYLYRYMFHGKVLKKTMRPSDFLEVFKMLKYWAITIPCFYYMTCNTYGSIAFVLTASSISEKLYDFNTAQTGALIGVPLTIGCFIGESCTGWISDRMINRYAKQHSGYRKPEVRLHLIWLALFLPAGLVMFGLCAQYNQPWISLAVAATVANVGTQVGTSITYTYCIESYKAQSAEVAAIINLFRQVFAFASAFYLIPFNNLGYGESWGTLAAINLVTLLPLLWLIKSGQSIRERQGVPEFHRDL